jgi:hypothetical protein
LTSGKQKPVPGKRSPGGSFSDSWDKALLMHNLHPVQADGDLGSPFSKDPNKTEMPQ